MAEGEKRMGDGEERKEQRGGDGAQEAALGRTEV